MVVNYSTRLDAPTIGAYQGQLEIVENRLITPIQPEFKILKLIPMEELDQPWAEFSTYQTIDGVGSMELRGPRSTNLPRVEMVGEEFSQRTYEYTTGYDLTDREIAATVHKGVPIEENKIQLVQRVYSQHLNKILLFGDRRTGTPGFLNDPRWLRMYAPFPLDGRSTHNQMLATMNSASTAVDKATNDNLQISPNTLLLPKPKYDYLKSQTRLEASDKDNVLSYFLGNNSTITDIDWLSELAGAGPNGEDIAVFYRRDPMCFKARITSPFRPKPLFPINPFEMYRAYSFIYGGILAYIRTSVLIMIGV